MRFWDNVCDFLTFLAIFWGDFFASTQQIPGLRAVVHIYISSDEVPPLPPILDGIAGPDAVIQDCVEHSRIHSRRFREYCDQVIDKQIDDLAQTILTDLNRFYQRLVQRNPHKAKSKRRFVLGIREVFKHLKLGKIKCVIVSPNLEKIQSKGMSKKWFNRR